MSGAAVAVAPRIDARLSRTTPAWLVPVLIGAVVFGIGALLVDGLPVGATNDDGMYVILAKSLATGRGYRWLHLPGAPPATHFPPGYPAVLALLWWLFPAFPANVIVFKLANALFMAVAAAGTFCLARTRLEMSKLGAAALTFAATLGIPMLTLSTIVMSEPLFLALLLPALLLAEHVVDDEPGRGRNVVALALLAGAATLVRTHGIALIGAIALVLCLRRRFRHARLFIGVALGLLLPWQLFVSIHSSGVPLPMRGNYESYGAWFASGLRADGVGLIARTVVRTIGELAGMLETLVSPSLPNALRLVALLALLVVSGVGLRELWRRAPVAAAFLISYTAIVVLWPFSPTRFIWGVWPLVMLLPVLGARRALSWCPTSPVMRGARMAALAGSVLLACGYAAYNLRGYQHQWWSSIPRAVSRNASPLLAWVASRTPRDVLLATEAECTVYLYTGRPVVPVSTFTVDEYFTPRTPAENAAAIRTIVSHYRPRAVVVTSGAMRDAIRELALGPHPLLAVVDTFPAGGLVLIPTSR